AIVCREIFLSDAFVPEANRLGGEGEGFYGLMRTFDISRVVLGAAALGTARAAYEYARDYARERTQFGKAIIDHQAVAFRLADMSARIDAAWLQVLNAARMIDAGSAVPRQRVTASAAMAKLNASETAMCCTSAPAPTLGGWGYPREPPAE
ncbi:acyl-CoA dehydrogenase, partial [Mycobacterium tuberculosis]|nr:acyl-CoA dehydrogenase [Mycobacterium tuberculosis]